ncbi:MAG: AMP-binding protein, partial [Actinomycetales bacterium]
EALPEVFPEALPGAPAGAAASGSGQELVDGPPDSDFLIGLTSGTSSVPKAFSRSRASWRDSFELSIPFFRLGREDVTLAPGPLSASVNLYALAECLYAGSPLYLLPEFGVAAAAAAIRRVRPTRLVLVPVMLKMLAERGLAEGATADGLRTVVCAGAKLDPQTAALARRWAPNAVLMEYFGASELGFIAAAAAPAGAGAAPVRPAASATGSHGAATAVGPAFPTVQISIRDESGHALPPGTPGTIHVCSTLVSNGYLWGDDGNAFARDGSWCTVQDRGYLDPDGTLHVQGRASDMLLCGGHNVYPQEIEAVLAGVDGVGAAVVTGRADGARGAKILAAVLPSAPLPAGLPAAPLPAGLAAALRTAADAGLPRYKRPHAYYALAQLPATGAGKTSRELLGRWIAEGDGRVRRLP